MPRTEKADSQYRVFKEPDGPDPRGPFRKIDTTANAKGGRDVASLHYGFRNPYTGETVYPRDGTCWRHSETEMKELQRDRRLYWGVNGTATTPMRKMFRSEAKQGMSTPSILPEMPLNQHAARELEILFGQKSVFDTPKPTKLLKLFVEIGSNPQDIALDFFAGSGSLGEAVMRLNAEAGSQRRYMLVQLPELIDTQDNEQKAAAVYCDKISKPRTIAELTKERLRLAGKQIKQENPEWKGDAGFRVFKLDSSNIRAWEPTPEDLEKTLLDNVEHIKEMRTEQDVLYELLLKLGLDLCVPIETRSIAGKDVHAVGGGVLMACLAEKIARDEVEPLAQGIVAWHEALAPAGDTTCVFRDSAFADDVAKTNLAAILEQHSVQNVRSL
jgi:adenine-specific DNA-methyltransferase